MSEMFENQEQSELEERYELAIDRVHALTKLGEEPLLSESMQIYVNQIAIGMLQSLESEETFSGKEICEGDHRSLNESSADDWKESDSFFSEDTFGPVLFPYLSCAAYMFQWVKAYKQRGQMEACVIHMELFLEIVGILRDGAVDRLSEKKLAHHLQQSLYYFISDYAELLMEDYLGYWLGAACGFSIDCAVEHDAYAGVLALFLNHNLKERILMQDAFWDGVQLTWGEENEQVLSQYHPKQLKLIKSLKEHLLDIDEEGKV